LSCFFFEDASVFSTLKTLKVALKGHHLFFFNADSLEL